MNPEFERLVDIMLTDGFIDDAEKALLLKRAQHLDLDTAEVEITLENKLYARRQQLAAENSIKDKCKECGGKIVNEKCERCGWTQSAITADSATVPYNEHKQYEKKLDELKKDLEKQEQTRHAKYTIRCFKILFTGGLYIIYKVFIRKERLFNGVVTITNPIRFKSILYSELSLATTPEPNDTEKTVKERLREYRTTLNCILWRQFLKPFWATSVVAAILALAVFTVDRANVYYANQKRTNDSIAKIEASKIDVVEKKSTLEIADSLFNSGNYDDALAMSKLLEYTETEKYLTSKAFNLLKLKKFKLARKFQQESGNVLLTNRRFELAEYLEKQKK